MRRLLSVGDLNADIAIDPDHHLAVGADTPGRVRVAAGGSAANVAAEVARLRNRVRFAGVVGDDVLGRILVDDLTGAGIDVRPVVRSDTSSRSVAVLIGDDGDRSMVSDLSTETVLRVDDVDDAWFVDVSWLHLTAYTWFPEGGPDTFRRLASLAVDAGIDWSVDPSSAPMLSAVRGARAAADSFAGASVLFPSLDEATVLVGVDDPVRAASRLLDLADTVVVTAGADGVTVARRGAETFALEAHRVDVVNSLGCGDAFAGGFLSARLVGLDDRTCAERGLASAARVLSLPTAR